MVLMAILRQREGARAVSILRELDTRAGRSVSRGTLYKIERMEAKGLVEWEAEAGTPERGNRPGRRFSVTERGISALQEAREAYRRLGEGLEGVLGESGS